MSSEDLKKLPLLEQFEIMEAIWLDLKDRVIDVPVPAQHRQLLDERHERVVAGHGAVRSWDKMEHTIGEQR